MWSSRDSTDTSKREDRHRVSSWISCHRRQGRNIEVACALEKQARNSHPFTGSTSADDELEHRQRPADSKASPSINPGCSSVRHILRSYRGCDYGRSWNL